MPSTPPFSVPAELQGGIVAIGNFDGVHLGHRAMIELLRTRAAERNVPAVVLTFDPHPIALLRPRQAPPALTTLARRIELLQAAGADHVLVYPTDSRLLNLSPERFFAEFIQQELQARGLVEGPNFFFGSNRAGNITLLQQLCRHAGLSLDVVPPVMIDGQLVSSSVIRSLITQGNLAAAVDLLGHPHRLEGVVVTGARRGRQLGFPTANLDHITTLVPLPGVYAGTCDIAGRTYAAAVNLGPNPTFGEGATKVESHLLDFHGDLYDQPLAIDLRQRLRDIQKFANLEALQAQLQTDLERVRKSMLGMNP